MIGVLPASSAIVASLAVALLACAALLVGGYLYRVSSSFKLAAIDELLIAFVIGLTAVAWIGIVLGQLGLLGGWNPLLLLVGLIALAGWRTNWLRLVVVGSLTPAPSPVAPGRGQPSWLKCILLLIALLTLGPALAYPDGWDELVYHATLPKRWLADGWPAVYVDLPYSAFPSLAEILFWLISPIDYVFVPRLLMWLCWCATLILMARVLQTIVTGGQALVLVMAFALCTTSLLVVNNCYVESILALDYAAMVFIMLRLHASADISRASGWQLPLGIVAGGAAAVKLTGVCAIAVVIVFLACQMYQRRFKGREALTATTIFVLTAVVTAVPFYVRPWIATGNPFYPYFAQWFSHDLAVQEMSRYHHAIGASFGIYDWTAIVAAPLLLSFDNLLYDGMYGGQLLLFIGLAIWEIYICIRRREFRASPSLWLALSMLGLYVFWFATAQQARFAILVWMTLILLAARGLQRSPNKLQRWITPGIALVTLVSFPWQFSGYYFSCWTSAVGLFPPVAHVAEGTGPGYLDVIEPLQRLSKDARVMLLFEHREFYLPGRPIIGTPFFQAARFTPPENFSETEDVMRVLSQSEITHVLMAKSFAGPDKEATTIDRLAPLIASLERCLQSSQLVRVWENEYYILWSVNTREP